MVWFPRSRRLTSPKALWYLALEDLSLATRYEGVLKRIRLAAARAGRDPGEVTLVAVTKTVPLPHLVEACGLGLRDFGESRVQEALPKRDQLAGFQPRWHLIGHVQTNKVRRLTGAFHLVHSLDSERLAEALAIAHTANQPPQRVLLQVNAGGEASKHGVSWDDAPALAERVASMPALQLEGLMAIPPALGDSRPHFRRLAELRSALRTALGLPLPHLSMGMSQDLEAAVEEGATLVRVGSALFPRP